MERMTWTEPSGSRLEMRPFVTASDQALGKKDRCAIAGRICAGATRSIR